MKIVGICSLYEPLAFLENRIRNLNQCDLTNSMIYFADCSSQQTWVQVKQIIERNCHFAYMTHHFNIRTTLYYTWDWVVRQMMTQTQYFCNINVDDIQDPTYFKKLSGYLDAHREVKIVSCPWLITNIKGEIWPPKHNSVSGPDINKTMGHFPMWRSEIHIGGVMFDPKMMCIGDSYFWGWTKKKYGPQSLAIYPETLCCYLSHENNLYYSSRGPHGESGEAWDRSIGG